ENLYQSQAPGRTAKPVRPSAWDGQPPPQSSHQPTLRTNIPPGPVFGTRSIPLLVKHYTAQSANPLFESNLIEFTDDALAVMTAYHWPGNLTELYQVVSKIAVTTETRVITSQQLPLRLRELKHWPALSEFLAGQEKQYIDMVLHACRGDKPAAAKVLGVDVTKLGS
ncbi:MAG: hypothetical protein EXS38_09150, partial [Opitutus sp.]|nr:hypothetical protein [Opitutus sp.]